MTLTSSEISGRALGMPMGVNSQQLLRVSITALTLGNSPNLIHQEFYEAQPTHQCQNQNERKLSDGTPFHPFMLCVKDGWLCFPSF